MAENNNIEAQGLKQLKRIENELEEIKDRTGNPKRTFINGIIYGAGAFVGGILAIILLGWVLAIAGLIPGFGDLAHKVGDTVNAARGR